MPQYEPLIAPDSESDQVNELHRMLQLGPPALIGPNGLEKLELPSTIYRLLRDVVNNMRQGRAVILIPEDEQLTTQSAANLLGVSRPHFVKLIEANEIPFTKAGTHRRVLLKDVAKYARTRDARRKSILDALAAKALSEGDYEGVPIPDGGEDE